MSEGLKISYDQEADVLYVSLARLEYTRYVEIGDDLILRLDPDSDEIVGFTIIDFAAHFGRRAVLSLDLPLLATLTPLRPLPELEYA
ncbi:MAG: DUF2283 domain-containing protein [Chloroflexi bacterium]|nr:DUF2283 domain-containing protein [Chloroflexota bacterium]